MSIKHKILTTLQTIVNGPAKQITAEIKFIFPSQRLSNKHIVITGGGRGLGKAMAQKFIAEGAKVLICGRNEKVLISTANEIGAQYLKLDTTDTASFPFFIERARQKLGRIDTLVNNAGISLHENDFFEVTPDTFDLQFATNLKGPFFLTQEFIKHLKSTMTAGQVLFISSEAGETVDYRPYGFTKGAINSMVKGLANLFRLDNIRINAVSPGITASEMTGVDASGNINANDYGCGRFYLPEEIAETACFLLSDAAGCISGQIITCNNAQTVNPRWK